jgi:hypothetical protein
MVYMRFLPNDYFSAPEDISIEVPLLVSLLAHMFIIPETLPEMFLAYIHRHLNMSTPLSRLLLAAAITTAAAATFRDVSAHALLNRQMVVGRRTELIPSQGSAEEASPQLDSTSAGLILSERRLAYCTANPSLGLANRFDGLQERPPIMDRPRRSEAPDLACAGNSIVALPNIV